MVTESSRTTRASADDLAYQRGILPGVSRTFALTIPVLPDALAVVTTNAYLLCRIADTIEDDPGLTHEQKSQFHARFVAVVKGTEDAEPFARDLAPLLSDRVLPAEHELVRNTPAVIRVTHGCSAEERAALTRCVAIMCRGMPEFQRNKSLRGLATSTSSPSTATTSPASSARCARSCSLCIAPSSPPKREVMLRLAVSFGQGLQMTNILKDIWDDRQSGACWLPRSVFARGTMDLERLEAWHTQPVFRDGLHELIGVGHAHLRNALEYTCLIPKREAGIRRFCLWAIGLAVLTLRKIHRHPTFRSGSEVKVSRRTVKATVLTTNLTLMSNRALRLMFARAADGLPLAADGARLRGGRASYRVGPGESMSFDEPVRRDGAFTIGFVAALAIECTSLRRHLPRAATWLVVQSGPGAARAAAAAQRARSTRAPACSCRGGSPGGSVPQSRPGTVVRAAARSRAGRRASCRRCRLACAARRAGRRACRSSAAIC